MMKKIYMISNVIILFSLAAYSPYLPECMFGLPSLAVLVPIYFFGGMEIASLEMAEDVS